MDEYIWPARNVAEYAYCPRLFYLMEIEGIHLPSADTELGQALHARVDRASLCAENEDIDTGRPRTVRSLVLTDNQIGVTATLDIAEIAGRDAVPVEYRKGRPRRSTTDSLLRNSPDNDNSRFAEPWPSDRVQIGLQTLLLETAGYTVTRAVIYYAAEKLRLEIPVDDALREEARRTLDAARAAAARPRPLPLVNDSRCDGCSLQPICLPDEVNSQRNVLDSSPRNLWPPRAEGIQLVAQQEGVRIGVNGMTLRFTDPEGKKVRDIPLANVESLSVLGNVQLSTQAIHAITGRGIPIAYLTNAGRLRAFVDPLDSVSAFVRRAQVRRFDDSTSCLHLAKAIIQAKIANQRTMIMRNAVGLPDSASHQLAKLAEGVSGCTSLESMRGFEGQAGAVYFKHFPAMLKDPDLASSFDTNGRQRRPPPDPVNATLSFAYTMLTHDAVAALRTARLEPSIGAYHVSRPGRPALALDLIEPFRPLVADSIVLSLFNRDEMGDGHFIRTAAGCALTEHGRRAFFAAYGRRMDTEVTHPVFGYKLSYRRMIMLHARMIAAWLLGEIPDLSFITTR